MYKDCFKMMDINKDGVIDKNDLRGAFDNVGVLMSESELDGLLGEISGPCTYDNMVKMFQEKMAGEGNDPDDLIVQASKAYDNEGKIDSKMFEHALKTWGDKMRTPMPRRRRRRRRRPPSKCHLQTIEVVKKMLKTFLDLRALKITVILTLSLSNSH